MSIQRTIQFALLAACCALSVNCGAWAKRGAAAPETKERARISPLDQVQTAYHEAAHAVIDVVLLPERHVAKVMVFSKVSEHRMGVTSWVEQKEGHDARWYRGVALVYYAGNAAEDLLFKKKPPEDDTDADRSAFVGLLLCTKESCDCPAKSRVGDRCLLDGWLASQRKALYEASKRCVAANVGPIMDLAKLLMLKPEDDDEYGRSLGKAELKAFFATHRLTPCPEK